MKQETPPSTNAAWYAAAIGVVVLVLLATLWPDSGGHSSSLVPLQVHAGAVKCLLTWCEGFVSASRFLMEDVVGNVLLFLPVGVTLAGALRSVPVRRRFWITVALGAALSIAIETIQSVLPTRVTDVDDLLFNVIGTGIGAILLIRYERHRTAATP